MGVSLSTARWLAPTAFLYNFAAQQYGIWSKPSMLDVHNNNLSFFSPQPFFIGAFFSGQQIAQIWFIYRLIMLNEKKPKEAAELAPVHKYAPYFALGNLCIGTWMFFWNSERLDISNIFVCINSFSQLYYCATQLDRLNTASTSSVLTHIVAKTFAGIGVLDFLQNTSVAYFKDAAPSTAVKVATGLGFAGMAAVSDWIFGACLVYDLVGLAVGQSAYGNPGWSQLLGAYAVGTTAIVGLRNYMIPPYVRKQEYALAGQDDVDNRV